MMGPAGGRYNRAVFGRWRRRGAAALFLALSCTVLLAAKARADEQIPVGPTPVVDAQLSDGTLTVKTWDRPDVQVVTSGRVDVQHIDASQADPRLPRQYTAWSQVVPTEHGDVTLPEESFVIPRLAGSSHDAIVARGAGNTTIMIPRGTALVTANVGSGQVNLRNYHGAFIAHVRDGGVSLNHVDGSGYVEALHGPVDATNSSFDRLRVRTATGNMLFRGCTSHQIEASSEYGSIVYDNGRFQPGLAHFESVHGNVALGVRGGAQIGARSGSGHIVSSFPNGTQLRGQNSAQATVRGGGPMVTAVSKKGSVYIYNGSVRAHPQVQAELRGVQGIPVQRVPQPVALPAERQRAAMPPPPPYPGARGYGVPPRSYSVPPRGYAEPQRNYAPPQRNYPPAQRNYAPPQRNYAPPQRGYAAPQRQQGQTRQAPPPGGGDGGRHHQPPH